MPPNFWMSECRHNGNTWPDSVYPSRLSLRDVNAEKCAPERCYECTDPALQHLQMKHQQLLQTDHKHTGLGRPQVQTDLWAGQISCGVLIILKWKILEILAVSSFRITRLGGPFPASPQKQEWGFITECQCGVKSTARADSPPKCFLHTGRCHPSQMRTATWNIRDTSGPAPSGISGHRFYSLCHSQQILMQHFFKEILVWGQEGGQECRAAGFDDKKIFQQWPAVCKSESEADANGVNSRWPLSRPLLSKHTNQERSASVRTRRRGPQFTPTHPVLLTPRPGC